MTFLRFIPALLLSLALSACSCSSSDEHLIAESLDRDIWPDPDALLNGDNPADPYLAHLDSMPGNGRKIKINPIGGNLGRVFSDSNYLHLEAARKIGIPPATSFADLWKSPRPLVPITTGPYYVVDNLTHSHPYLVPEAARLLRDIAVAFHDSLQARGGGDYRLKVTSVYRTPDSVRKLRRRNVNASDASAHQFGTTFDISYSKFIADSDRLPRTQEDLKNLLGEVMNDMRNRGRCYVKYERKQGCFHITARPD